MYAYCEMPEFYHETTPQARKPHRCVECVAPITQGEKHLHYRGRWDGEFSDGRQHLQCWAICTFIRDHFQGGECFAFGGLEEAWGELRHHFYRYDGKGPRPAFTPAEIEARGMMARIWWRSRKHRTHRKRVGGVLMNRRWGAEWVVVPEHG